MHFITGNGYIATPSLGIGDCLSPRWDAVIKKRRWIGARSSRKQSVAREWQA